MEAKKGLNNTQRKVLEEIYVAQLEAERKVYSQERRNNRQSFIDKALEREMNSNPVKGIMAADRKRAELLEKHADYLKSKGIYFNQKAELEIRFNYGWETPSEVSTYDNETSEVESKYTKAKQEIRAKIWGMDETYEDIEAAVKSVLAGIK